MTNDTDTQEAETETAPVPSKGKAILADDTAKVPVVRTSDLPPAGPGDIDDLDEDLPENPKKRRRARQVTTALGLIAALGVGFLGGVYYQKQQSPSSGAGAFPSAFGGAGGASGAGGRPSGAFPGFGGSGASSGSVSGTVSAVSGNTLYVSEGSSSGLTKVTTTGSTSFTVPSSGSVTDVRPGDTVAIQGAKQKNGSFQAASVTDSGSSSSSSSASSSSGT